MLYLQDESIISSKAFLKRLQGCLEMDTEDKTKILDKMSELNQYQIQEFIKLFDRNSIINAKQFDSNPHQIIKKVKERNSEWDNLIEIKIRNLNKQFYSFLSKAPISVKEKKQYINRILKDKTLTLSQFYTILDELKRVNKCIPNNPIIKRKITKQWKSIKQKQDINLVLNLKLNLKFKIRRLIEEDMSENNSLLSPREILLQLNKTCFGNEKAKKILVAAFQHQKVRSIDAINGKNIQSNDRDEPILIIGKTGCGKTYLCTELAKLVDINFVRFDASQLVPEGLVGTSLSSIGKQLYLQSNKDLTVAAHSIVYLDEFDKLSSSTHADSIMPQLLTLLDGTNPIRFEERTQGQSEMIEIPTDNLLFVLSGSFSLDDEYNSSNKTPLGFAPHIVNEKDALMNTSLIEELDGRILKKVKMDPPSKDDLKKILMNSSKSPIVRLRNRMQRRDIKLVVSDNFLNSLIDTPRVDKYCARGAYQEAEDAIFETGYEFDLPELTSGTYEL